MENRNIVELFQDDNRYFVGRIKKMNFNSILVKAIKKRGNEKLRVGEDKKKEKLEKERKTEKKKKKHNTKSRT